MVLFDVCTNTVLRILEQLATALIRKFWEQVARKKKKKKKKKKKNGDTTPKLNSDQDLRARVPTDRTVTSCLSRL